MTSYSAFVDLKMNNSSGIFHFQMRYSESLGEILLRLSNT